MNMHFASILIALFALSWQITTINGQNVAQLLVQNNLANNGDGSASCTYGTQKIEFKVKATDFIGANGNNVQQTVGSLGSIGCVAKFCCVAGSDNVLKANFTLNEKGYAALLEGSQPASPLALQTTPNPSKAQLSESNNMLNTRVSNGNEKSLSLKTFCFFLALSAAAVNL